MPKPRTIRNQSLNKGLYPSEQEVTEPLPAPKGVVPHIVDGLSYNSHFFCLMHL